MERQSPMNEAETRAEHIDPALKAAGWGVVEGSKVLREHGITQGRIMGAAFVHCKNAPRSKRTPLNGLVQSRRLPADHV